MKSAVEPSDELWSGSSQDYRIGDNDMPHLHIIINIGIFSPRPRIQQAARIRIAATLILLVLFCCNGAAVCDWLHLSDRGALPGSCSYCGVNLVFGVNVTREVKSRCRQNISSISARLTPPLNNIHTNHAMVDGEGKGKCTSSARRRIAPSLTLVIIDPTRN